MRALYSVVTDALFPLSEAEVFLRTLSPESAAGILPPAPPYDASVMPMPGTQSLFAYKDECVSCLVWSIKYKRDAHAVAIGGYALHRKLQKARLADDRSGGRWVVVPIPITERRRRERGYNQCELLLDEIRRLDVGRELMCEKGLLVRTLHKNRQTLKGRADRLESASGIFAVDAGRAAQISSAYGPDIRVIIIDDVITTGSTMKAALDAVASAGFRNVSGLSLAH